VRSFFDSFVAGICIFLDFAGDAPFANRNSIPQDHATTLVLAFNTKKEGQQECRPDLNAC
jgi:hypothetical protein